MTKPKLGSAAATVFTAPRRAPSVLAPPTEPTASGENAQVVLRRAAARLEADRRALIADLEEALDGWADAAGEGEARRIAAVRRRWGIANEDAGGDVLTDATRKS